MKIKEKIECMIKIHTRVVTGIFLFLCLYLLWLPGDASIRIKDILGIQIIGLISALAYIPLMTDKEFSKTKMIVMNFLYFLTINVTVFITGFTLNWLSLALKESLLFIEGMIIIVYVLMMLIAYKVDSNQANEMNKKLSLRNNKEEPEVPDEK